MIARAIARALLTRAHLAGLEYADVRSLCTLDDRLALAAQREGFRVV